MNHIPIEVDIAESLRQFLQENVRYPLWGGWHGNAERKTITGFIDPSTPYGDIYEAGDKFLEQGLPNQVGTLWYVIDAHPGSPRLVLQREQPQGYVAPEVAYVEGQYAPQIDEGDRVHIGITSRPQAQRRQKIPFNRRRYNADGTKLISPDQIWEGAFWLHIEGRVRPECASVLYVVNQSFDITTRIYQLDARLRPVRDEVRTQVGKIFKNVLSLHVSAYLTATTPVHELPPYYPGHVWDGEKLLGISGALELLDTNGPPYYGEKIGDFPLSGNENE